MSSIYTKVVAVGKDNVIVILMALCMAVLVASPHLRAYMFVGAEDFRGVHVQFNDDEVTYQARIKEVVEGNFAIGNPYIKEHMDDPFIMPPVAEWTIAFFVWVTGTSVPFITSVSDGVLGFVSFLLIYTLFLVLTKHKWITLLYTTVFMFFSLATFGRPISPQFNALFLFAGLITISKIYFNPAVWCKKWNSSAGLITGVTCFISPYYFTALLGFYVLVFFLRSVYERSMEPIKKNVPWFFFTFLPLALIYAFFQIKAGQDLAYSETVLRYGLLHTHIPGSFTNMLFGGIALGVLTLCFKSLHYQKFVFALGALLTLFALNWQNILTGKSLQFSSHYLFTSILLICISLALIHGALISREMVSLGNTRKALIVGGIVFLCVLIGHNQKDEFMNLGTALFTRAELLHEQKKMDVFNWFIENTEQESVVYVLGGGYDFLLPVYTHNKVFYNFYAALYPAFDVETEERWLIQNLFNEDMSTTTILGAQREYWGNRYIDIYQSTENRKKIVSFITRSTYTPSSMIPESKIEYMYSRWLDVSSRRIEENFHRYELDYILVSVDYPYFEEAVTRLENIAGISFVADIQGNRVYKFQSSTFSAE